MKSRELRKLSDEKLVELYEDKKQDLYVMREQRRTGELKDTNALRRTRRDVARILTIQRERQLAAALAQSDKQ